MDVDELKNEASLGLVLVVLKTWPAQLLPRWTYPLMLAKATLQ